MTLWGHTHISLPHKPFTALFRAQLNTQIQAKRSEAKPNQTKPSQAAIIVARAGRRFIQSLPLTLFREPIEWVDTTRYLGVTLDTRLTWSPHIDQVRKRTAQKMGMLGPLLYRKSDLSVRN